MYIKGCGLQVGGIIKRHTSTFQGCLSNKYLCVHDKLNRCNLIVEMIE